MKTLTPQLNGVYRMPQRPDQVRAAAAGIACTVISLQGIRGRNKLIKVLAKSLKFPSTFGGNWDALADCLQDLSWLPERGHVLELAGLSDFSAAAPDDLALLLEILDASAAYWRQHDRVFVVLIDGVAALPEFPRR